ncbi:MAG: hypothetical protein E7576_00775 [Ruminococcaceae bacterium]|jgi:hypothetical protein|nr:hypothetical protein [Oscillospiraceae bacterium]
MNKRLTSLLLALLLTFPAFAAGCSESSENNTDSKNTAANTPSATDAGNTGEEEAETEFTRAMVKDDLPDDLDFNGATQLVLARTKAWFTGEMFVEELNGETLNDAVYQRDTAVEERLNVVIDYSLVDDTNGVVNKNVTAGADEVSIHVGSAVDTVQYGVNGNYYNLLGDAPVYLNLEQPWWSQYYTQQESVMGKAFFATGDLFTSLIKLSFVTYANMKLVNDYQLESPYDLVRSGQWTFDKEMEMASLVHEDKNGNGVRDKDDSYGMTLAGMIGLDVYWSAFDLTICEKDANDVPTFSVDEEKMSAVLEKLYSYYIDCEYCWCPPNPDSDKEQDEVAQMLAEDRILFTPLRIMHTDQIRDMESPYGLIPLPKWNEEQTNYYTFVHDQYSIGGIPVSVQDPAMTSAVMEALAAESYRFVTPAYYDVVLNGKYLRDADSSEMLELAMAGVKIDFGWIHTYSLGSCSQGLLREILYNSKSSNFSSVYKSKQKAFAKMMSKLVEKIEKIDH